MFGLLRAPSRSAGTAIGYITVGILMMIWTGIWYYSMHDGDETEPVPGWQKYTCMGLFFSGLAITVIGFLFGQIGGAAKEADNTVGMVPAAPVAPAAVPGQATVVTNPPAQPGTTVVQ